LEFELTPQILVDKSEVSDQNIAHFENLRNFHQKSNLESFLELSRPRIHLKKSFKELINSIRELSFCGFKFAFDYKLQ
jgi:hypothetical protein